MRWSILGLLLWLSLFLSSPAIYFFIKGFLLTRTVLTQVTQCHNPLGETQTPLNFSSQQNVVPCPSYPVYKKAIILVIDALRYDFAHVSNPSTNQASYYRNKLPIFETLAKNKSNIAYLYKFLADPPTTTIQRLKGLTTGTLPTFIEAGSNFGGSAIVEDNWIYHLHRAGLKWLFFGDDTWASIYPEFINKTIQSENGVLHSVTYPSFDVWDLHTVDDGIMSHLDSALKRPQPWHALTLHFLGVDHCGHRYGPNHPEMEAKLVQMNHLISRIADTMDSNTVLFVMGDHGMDSKGDHGGDSPEELEAALFIFSPGRAEHLSNNTWINHILQHLQSQTKVQLPFFTFSETVKEQVRTIRQVDFVPTLSLLLGLPVPFGNLGSLILEPFLYQIAKNNDCEKDSRLCFQELLHWLDMNSQQVYAYLKVYSTLHSQSELAEIFHSKLDGLFHKILMDHSNGNLHNITTVSLLERMTLQLSFLNEAFRMCQHFWTSFDVFFILVGVLLFSIPTLHLLLLMPRLIAVDSFKWQEIMDREWSSFKIYCFAAVTGYIFQPFHYVTKLLSIAAHITAWEEAMICGCLVGGLHSLFHRAGMKFIEISCVYQKYNPLLILCLIMGFTYSLFTASNSFIVYEDAEVFFLLQSLGILLLYFVITNFIAKNGSFVEIKRVLFPGVVFLIINRLSLLSTICREEQGPSCIPTFYLDETTSISSPAIILISLVFSIFFPWIYETSTKCTLEMPFKYLLCQSIFLGSLYWAVEEYPPSSWNPNILWWLTIGNARWILLSGLFGFIWWYLQRRNQETLDLSSLRTWILQRHSCLISVFYAVFYLLQKPMGHIQLSMGLLGLLFISHVLASTSKGRGWRGDIIYGIFICFSSFRTFFSTGHQATLSSIQWSVGFIGLRETHFVGSFLLVFFNTFGPLCLFTLSFPFHLLHCLFYESKEKESCGKSVGHYLKRMYWGGLRVVITMLILHHLASLSSLLFTGIFFRRHLMVWKVFLPKLMLCLSQLGVFYIVIVFMLIIL